MMFLLLHMYNVSRFLFVIVSLLLFLFLSTTQAAPSYIYHICGSNTTIYTPNSSYHTNLNRLLSFLSANVNRDMNYGFSNDTAGYSGPDVAYGLYLCRGDVTAVICRDCMETATTEITSRCPEEREAVVWYDECMLRYSNQSFATTVDLSPSLYMWNTGNVTDPTRFQQVMGETMLGLANLASNDSPNDQFVRGFGTREVNFTSLQTVYGMVQCTPDLSGTDCHQCLRGAIAQLPTCCGGKQGGRILGASCSIRYALYPFYGNLVTGTAPPPTPTSFLELPRPSSFVPPPPPSSFAPPPTPNSTGGKTKNTKLITIVASVSAFLVVVLLGFCIGYRMRRKRIEEEKKEYSQEVHLINLIGNRLVDDYSNENSLGEKEAKSQDFPLIRLDLIRAATQQFSEENKLGEGGFGPVYKGTLVDGKEIAVKRLSRDSGQGLHEFKNEVTSISKLQHRNLVRLLGCCLEGNELLLVYDYMPNKSLDIFLFGLTHKLSLLDSLLSHK